MNKNFVEMFEKIASMVKKDDWKTVLNEDGIITDLDIVPEKAKQSLDILNCYQNPYYFIDKLKYRNKHLKINLGTYLAVKHINLGNNVLLDLPPMAGKTLFVCAISLYKLMCDKTNNGNIVICTNYREDFCFRLEIIKDMYHSLPDYLQIISWDDISKRIFMYNDKIDMSIDNVLLMVYDDKLGIKEIDQNIPSIIAVRGKYSIEARKVLNKLNNPNFKEIKFNFIDLGFDYKWAEDMFKMYNGEMETFLKEVCQMY